MNGLLRGKYPNLGDSWTPMNDAATTALNKLANDPSRVFQGTAYRGTKMTEGKVHERFPAVGQTYIDKGFSSSTTDQKKAFPGNVQIKMESKSGI